jgi:hypothetical protein
VTSVTDAYVGGSRAALTQFNVRLAFDAATQRMPDGPEHLGAEWLAKKLSDPEEPRRVIGSAPSYRKLEKPPMWGPRASLESSTANARNYSGVGAYGGV